MRYDLTIVGHIVLDYIRRGKRVYGPVLGGPCVYVGLSARTLGASVAVVSKVGKDFGRKRLSWLRSRGIAVECVRITNSPTTCFAHSYRDGSRRVKVTSICEPIRNEDLSNAPSSSAVHVGSVLDEVAPSQIMKLKNRHEITSLDPQGFLRSLGSDGHVRIVKWADPQVMRSVNVLRASESELHAIPGKINSRRLSTLGPEIILISRGTRGTTVWSKYEGMFKVPAYATGVEDPTGAGDALIGGFLASWIRREDLLWSVAVGSAVASFVVEKIGPKSFGSPRQIERRANKILEGTTRVR